MGRRRAPDDAVPAQPLVPARSHRRSPRAALRDALAVPAARDGARRPPVARARPVGGTRRVLRRDRRLGARQLVRTRRRRRPSTSTATDARTGSNTRLPSTTPSATPSACSTRPRSPSSGSKASMRSGSSTASARTTSPFPIGKIVYTQWLNDNGGIEADLTVTREADDRFLIVTAAATQVRDFHWLKNHIGPDDRAIAVDVTSGSAVFSVMGPNARAVPAAADPDRPLQRRVPVRHIAGDRPRLRPRPRQSRHLRGRARLGAVRADRVRGRGVRRPRPSRRTTRAGPRRLPRAQLAAHGEGLPPLGPRRHPRHHPARGRSRVRRRVGQARRLHRQGSTRPSTRGRRLRRGSCSSLSTTPTRCSTTTSRSGAMASSSARPPPACSATRSGNRSGWDTSPIATGSPTLRTSTRGTYEIEVAGQRIPATRVPATVLRPERALRVKA